MSGYVIQLSYNNQAEGFFLPMLPPSIEVVEGGQGKTYNIVGLGGGTEETRAGEVNVIGNPKLREVSFSSIFPGQFYPFLPQDFEVFTPMHYIDRIQRWKTSKHPIRFIFAGSYKALAESQDKKRFTDINFPASIESFTWSEKAGSPGDIEYKLNLKEYVFYAPRKVITYTNAAGEKVKQVGSPPRPDERIRPATYTLKPNAKLFASLMEAAMSWYNDSGYWRTLATYNKFREDRLLEPVGNETVIQLPRK